MQIKTGCDIVHLPKFHQKTISGGAGFLNKIFSTSELSGSKSDASLAGIFAAKEAVIKALGWSAGDWLDIEITQLASGKPSLTLPDMKRYHSYDLSISHDGDYALALVTFIIK